MNAAAIIRHLNNTHAPLGNSNINVLGTSINGILNELFDYRCRTRHYLTRGKLVDQQRGEFFDTVTGTNHRRCVLLG